jgi:hypothetical protein
MTSARRKIAINEITNEGTSIKAREAVRRFFQRSTNALASRPITAVDTDVARKTPLTARRAQSALHAVDVTIQSTSVVFNA